MRPTSPEFDACAGDYDSALQRGLSVTGENREFFARARIVWLAAMLRRLGEKPGKVMDYGCGTGTGAHFLDVVLAAGQVVGVDVSLESLAVARKTWGQGRLAFLATEAYRPDGRFDLVFCNGVFHHIPPEQRAAALAYIHRSLRVGGMFSFWENNPWNPATRLVMRRIPFDRNAITVSAPAARDLLKAAGFHVLRTDFLFVFPRLLAWMRWVEPWVSRLPLGAQYQVLCRKA